MTIRKGEAFASPFLSSERGIRISAPLRSAQSRGPQDLVRPLHHDRGVFVFFTMYDDINKGEAFTPPFLSSERGIRTLDTTGMNRVL